MRMKMMVGAALAAAFTLGSSVAEATVVVADEPVFLLPATPGIVVGAGAMVTTIGAAVELDSIQPSMGWAVSGIVFGSLSVISGGIYAGVAAELQSDAAQRVFLTTSVANMAFGTSSLALGIAAAAAGPEIREIPIRPMTSFDADGRPFAAISGTF